MTRYQFGDLVIVVTPHSDEAVVRARPVLVLVDTGDEDIVVARITRRQHSSAYDVAVTDWQQAGLLNPSYIRLHKASLSAKRLVVNEVGRLSPPDLSRVKSILKEAARKL